MTILSFKQRAGICTVAISVGLILAVAEAGQAFADESLDKVLATAMEKNPDIVTAKAKVVLAEAELNAIRLQIARQVVSQWNNLESHRAINEQVQSAYKGGAAGAKEARESKAKLQQLETELMYLSGGAEIAGVKQKICLVCRLKQIPCQRQNRSRCQPVRLSRTWRKCCQRKPSRWTLLSSRWSR